MKQVEQEEIIEMEGDKKDETLPPGFRFHPSDEELITYYLVNKISDSNFTGRAIVDVDLNKSEPWDLPGKAKMGENEWYFFNLRDRKYPTGVRTNRATNIGYRKTTGKDKEIFNNITSELIGMKKTLVFYRGRAPRGEKTNWIIHEYRIPSKSTFKITKDEWVVCRVFQKSAGAKRFPTSSSQLPRAVNVNPPYNFQFPTDQLAELTRMFRGCASTSVNNLPIQSPMNYVPLAGGFTVSGLNLNFGGATTQPLVLPPQAMNQQDVMMTTTSYAADQFNQANAASGSRYMSMEHCMDLDGYYWPPY